MQNGEQQEQSAFEGWAIVEVLGRRTYAGYVKTEAYGQAVMFRVDVPALEARDRVTDSSEWSGNEYLPAGATVKEGAVAGFTTLIGSGSIYCLTPCTKEAALKALEKMQRRPLMSFQLPPERALAGSEPIDVNADEDDPDDVDGDGEDDELGI